MVGRGTGETYHERSKGNDVRTSNIIAAKVSICSPLRQAPLETIHLLLNCSKPISIAAVHFVSVSFRVVSHFSLICFS